jgi:peptidoglycan/LPS O-acetylase OafA/YrhL
MTYILSDKNIENKKIYYPEIDGLRFLAFILVFIHHQSLFAKIPYLCVLNSHGWIGVDLFFGLSAFLFTKLLSKEYEKTKTISFKKFYLRRIFRIWPIYFLIIGASVLIYFITGGSVSKMFALRLIGMFTFSENIITAIYNYNPLPFIAHLWTITYEEQFYLFIPLIILSLVRSSAKAKIISLFTILLIFNLIRFGFILNNVPHPAIWVLPITHFESIVLGIVVGFGGFDFLTKRINSTIIGLSGIALFLAIVCMPNFDIITYWLILGYTIVGLSTSLIIISVLNNKILKSFFSNNILVFLGKRSYGLYVYHLLGNSFAVQLTKYVIDLPSNYAALFIYSLTFTIIVSILSYKFVETPFLKLKKKFEIIESRPI